MAEHSQYKTLNNIDHARQAADMHGHTGQTRHAFIQGFLHARGGEKSKPSGEKPAKKAYGTGYKVGGGQFALRKEGKRR